MNTNYQTSVPRVKTPEEIIRNFLIYFSVPKIKDVLFELSISYFTNEETWAVSKEHRDDFRFSLYAIHELLTEIEKHNKSQF